MADIADHDGRASSIGFRERLFGREAVMLVLLLVIVPNLLFLALSPWLMIRRTLSPLVWLLAGVLSFLLPRPFSWLLFLAAAAVDAFLIVAFAFDMPFSTSFAALRYLGDINVAVSALYMAGALYGVVLALGVAFVFNRHRARLREASVLPALVAALAVGWVDHSVNGFKPIAKPPFESAVTQIGVTADGIAARDVNLLIVMVEGMGAYARPEERTVLSSILVKAAGERYRITSGTTAHHGSTTGATARELCGRWATFVDFLDAADQDCLPAQLARSGYDTVSYHASYSALFSRKAWYPKIGFRTTHFREDIERSHPELAGRLCGSVTAGLCDDDMARLVQDELALARGKRKFVYWLTLNSHLPYQRVDTGRLHCGEPRAAISGRMACDLTEIWAEVMDGVAAILRDPAMPPLDILVVGDHNTPMWWRSDFRHFVKGRVDWYYLEDRRGRSQPRVPTANSPAG